MLDKRVIFEMHRLKNAGMSNREIAGELRINRGSVSKYLNNPTPSPAVRKRKPVE